LLMSSPSLAFVSGFANLSLLSAAYIGTITEVLVALIVLAPAKQSDERASAAGV